MSNYKKVYFRIRTSSYYNRSTYGVGFENQESANIFDKAATEIFLNEGWKIKEKKYTCGCTTVIKDKQELYLHPQSFSGVVKEENIKGIEELLNNSTLFKFERIDIYEDIFDITDEEYINILESKRNDIENDILEAYKTKRSNLYITGSSPVSKILDKYRVKRLSSHVGVYSNDNIDWKFIEGIFDDLVKNHQIITANTKYGLGYRTAKEKELKSFKTA
jgi:hypothetical protein